MSTPSRMAIKTPGKTPTDSFEVQHQRLNLPPPQTFEILPPLHELLARIDAYQNQGLPPDSSSQNAGITASGTNGGPTSTPTLTSATPLIKPSTGLSSSTATGTGTSATDHDLDTTDFGFAYAEVQPLNPKELPTVALEIKSRIRHALRELEKLPDMERSVEEQEEEMRALEDRIRRQRKVLEDLRGVAAGMVGRVG